ncbi:MAG: sensor histidine kinase [Phycisphaerales bacterium]|nr:sensor histidine kinase [Phycisphaerales bacterium]
MAKAGSATRVSAGDTIPFKIHPRAFKALGAGLVTNDVVAIIELVKNAYDAYATRVDVRFAQDEDDWVLEIEDNGSGMSRSTIEEAWCTVATPYRKKHAVAKQLGKRNRRASGEKGLGRLSAARLGAKLEMTTQAKPGDCWTVHVNWEKLANCENLNECVATITRAPDGRFEKSGTLLRIFPLRTIWNDATWDDLRDNLGRLLPPIAVKRDFAIGFRRPGSLFDDVIDVKPPEFLKHPKYQIRGTVEESGTVRYRYQHRAILGEEHRTATGTVSWKQIRDQADDATLNSIDEPGFGPFEFELRAWDIAQHDTQEIAERFELRKSTVRRDIRAFKGISVYRDDVLVLPKSEGTRDWLGLDVRRIGKVGPRLSTPQLVGYVAISAAHNPDLEDTSDRERLVATPEVLAFEATLRTVVSVMENERDKDRREVTKERRVADLFKQLSAKELVLGVAEVANEGGSASEALPLVEEFSENLDKARGEIETRFVYYSRLATVGTIAHMLVHEVRNRTTVLGHVLDWLAKRLADLSDDKAASKLEMGRAAVAALDKLAGTFAPLANRQFKRRMRSACVEESALRCLLMLERELKAGKIRISSPTDTVTEVAVDPGELDAVLLNLLGNAVYWLTHKGDADKRIEIRTRKISEGKRVSVGVHDSGPGVAEEDAEKIFWPGVTNKPGGIGMGLTVASELVAEYEGKLALERKGKLGGATFVFDVPLKQSAGA